MYHVHWIYQFLQLQRFSNFCLLFQFVTVILKTTETKAVVKKSSDSNSITITNFVSSLISSRFNHCTFLIVESETDGKLNDDNNQEFVEVVENILRKTSQDSFLIQLPRKNESNNKSSNITDRYNIISDLHQYRDKCTVGVFVIHDDHWPSLPEELYEHSTKWSKILKKDEDYFLYLTEDESTSKEILGYGSSIALKVKFKALIQQSNSGEILMSSICFYCDNGSPTIFPIQWGHLSHSNQHPQLSKTIQFTAMKDLFPDFVKNMYGKVMKVTAPTTTGWLHEILQEKGGWISKRGVYKFVVGHLMMKHNFTCVFFPASGTGVQFKNGTWAGAIGDIVNKHADIGYPAAQTWHRDKVVGFAGATTYEKIGFTSGEPLPFFSWKAVFWPLSYEVWLGLGLSYIFVNIFLYILNKAARDGNPANNAERIIAYTWSSLLEQDLPITGSFLGHPIRSFIAFWMIFTLVVATAYRSQLVSFLAFPNVEKLPTTFGELAKSDFTIALQYLGGAAYQMFRTSTSPTYQTLFGRMELEPVDSKCFARAIGNRFACISWVTTAEFVYRRNLSDQHGRVPLVRAQDSVSFISCSIFMEKRAIFRTNFNKLIINAADSGLTEKWREMDMDFVYEQRRIWERATRKAKVTYAEQESWGPLTNKHFKGAFYILVFGVIIGLISFLWENFSSYKRQRSSPVDEIVF